MTENEYLREQIAGLKAELSSLKAAGTGSTFKFIDDPELGTIVEKSQDGYIAELRGEIADLKAAGTRADGIEAAAKVADGFTCGVCGMDSKAAAVIRALSPAPEAKPFQSLDDLKKGNPVADQLKPQRRLAPDAKPVAAIEALRSHQIQLDQDGIQVGVSRQALEEVLSFAERKL